MAQFEMVMPKMGESVAEATIIKWLKNEGDKIEADEMVLEIATDKVDSEVPAQNGGILVKRMFNEGDVVQVGAVIAIISNESTDAPKSPGANGSVAQTAVVAEKPVVATVTAAAATKPVMQETVSSSKF